MSKDRLRLDLNPNFLCSSLGWKTVRRNQNCLNFLSSLDLGLTGTMTNNYGNAMGPYVVPNVTYFTFIN